MPNLSERLRSISLDNPSIVATLVVDGAGSIRHAEGTSPELARAAIALLTPLRDLLERAAAELGCGALRTAFLEGETASFALADVDGSTSALVVGCAGAKAGALRADALRVAEITNAAGAQ